MADEFKENGVNIPQGCEAVNQSTQNAINTCKNASTKVGDNLTQSKFGEKLQGPVIKNGVIEFNGRIFELPPGGASVSLAKDGSGLLRCMDKDGNYLPTPTEIKNNESGSSISSVASLGSYDGAVALIEQANSRASSRGATERADGIITNNSVITPPLSSSRTSSAEGVLNSLDAKEQNIKDVTKQLDTFGLTKEKVLNLAEKLAYNLYGLSGESTDAVSKDRVKNTVTLSGRALNYLGVPGNKSAEVPLDKLRLVIADLKTGRKTNVSFS